ncbi:hypothetical protein JK169_00735 [Acetobacter persici]|uniref:hypothetical protein n=1 Tax=Acetobacter persici TaxID=1076596 RepID=UPI001BABB487|nr:hypothetical protein [Acetobacter persici]MBS0999551.1 hypothetical protein [Acetobacter persici]
MPRKDKISSVTMVGTIEDLIADLENERKERAARKPATAFGVITQIYPTLLSMKADGWSDMEICTTLKTRGITLSPGTLSTYMKKIGREKRTIKPKPPRAPKVDSATPSPPSPSMRGFTSQPPPLLDA